MKIIKCMTNHMENPVGYAMDHAVVSWIAESTRSLKQDRAQITVALDKDMKEVIYSGDPLASPDSTGVKLPFELKPHTEYYWTVQVWGDGGDSAISEVNSFETGKKTEPLGGEWITTPWEDPNMSPYIRKKFHLEEKITKAKLYITGLGLYWLEINGRKATNDFFAPGCNAYDKWLQIYTYDVTELLHTGDNVIGVLMGNGWAKGRFGCKPKLHIPYTHNYLLKAELRLELADGSERLITTDDTWKCCPSPVLADNIYDGEVYDERKAVPNWSGCDCCEDKWDQMKSAGEVNLGTLEDRLSLPIVIKETRKPAGLIHTPAGEWVLDMGQNMTGWLRMKVQKPAGTQITLSYSEILQDDCFYRDNLRTAKAQYVYISDGTEKEAEPHFTFYGFRYVKVEGLGESINPEDFTGCVVYSDLEENGWLTTSDERINRLFANAKWSQKGNFLDVPTDCPQRDERMGWTGDAQVFCKTASYNMSTYAFYTKYLHDLWYEQQRNYGMVSHVVPSLLKVNTDVSSFWDGGSCAWGDAAVIIPWTLYNHYADITILERQYPSMKGWIDWIVRKNVGATGLWDTGFHFGDWLALDGTTSDTTQGGTDKVYIASAYLKYSSGLVAKAARILGFEDDAAYYEQISERTKAAIQNTYFTDEGRCSIQTQTANILALAFELADTEARSSIASDLAALLKQQDMHLQTGFVGTPFLCKVLSEQEYSKEAYELLFKDDFPSWLYEVDMGATTIWERWNSVLPDGKISDTGMNSLNHYAYGSIAQWMYENMVGLTLKEPGFKSFCVKPEYTEKFTYVHMQYLSPKGKIEIKWEKETNEKYKLYVKVPFDTTAIVQLPGTDEQHILTAGEYYL